MIKRILFSACFSLLVLAATAQEQYKSPFWGLQMSLPSQWLKADKGMVQENVKDYTFNEVQLKKVLSTQKNAVLLLAMTKRNPEEQSGIIPTIKVNAKAIDIQDNSRFFAAVSASVAGWFKVLDDAHFETEPTDITIGGVPATYCVFTYNLPGPDGKPLKARTFMYSVLRKGYFLQFNFTDCGKAEDCSALFAQLIHSVHFI